MTEEQQRDLLAAASWLGNVVDSIGGFLSHDVSADPAIDTLARLREELEMTDTEVKERLCDHEYVDKDPQTGKSFCTACGKYK